MITIKFEWADVMRDVVRTSEYIGAKSEDYDRVRATILDEEQLQHYFADALAVVAQALDRVTVGPVICDGNTVTMTLSVNNSAKALLCNIIPRYTAAAVLTRWVQIVVPNLTQVYKANEDQLAASLMQVAMYREMPS